MMQKPITPAEAARLRIAIVTLDGHLSASVARAQARLAAETPGLSVTLHAASEWAAHPDALARARDAVARADVVVACMLFIDEHVQAIRASLTAARDRGAQVLCCLSAAEVVKLTRLGKLDMSQPATGVVGLLKRLRGKPKEGGGSSGAGQMAMLRRLPKILKYIPGKAQDLRAYFLTMQYWLSGSDENVAAMLRFLATKYGQGRVGAIEAAAPVDYPETGLYHPRLPGRLTARREDLPRGGEAGTVGLLVMRSYVLAADARHYDGMIAALEARGLTVVPAFAAGLDARPAIEAFFQKDGRATVDAVLSLTGFSLVGGPAYNDARAAEEVLAALDVPYVAAHALEFQTLEEWRGSGRGLTPVEATIMIAIPELDGATGPTVFGGRSGAGFGRCEGCDRRCELDGAARDMQACHERAERLAARVENLIRLRRADRADRRVAITLFNFPPNAGATGTAAFLSVFESLHNTLRALKAAGYAVDPPPTVDALRAAVLEGNAALFGADANVHARVPADVHVRRGKRLREIEAQWGPAPGKALSNGREIFILGARFGNVFVGVQPGFGYEGDPMRLLFEKGFAPTHAFSAFYDWLRHDFDAHAVLHFGTHGALEFMPGKQTGLDAESWPDTLIGDLPNLYLYAANNPSEGALAKRRANATLVSYVTPPLASAGLYRGLVDLKASLDRWRGSAPDATEERALLAELIQAQAAAVDLAAAEPAWADPAPEIEGMARRVLELEYELIPCGLHVVGEAPEPEARAGMLAAVAEATLGVTVPAPVLSALCGGATPEAAARAGGWRGDLSALRRLADIDRLLAEDHETPALIRALDGRYIRPAPGGDLLRSPDVLPTGRNLHGFDPFRIPSAFAVADGARQAARLLARHVEDAGALPKSVAIVLWGADNLKSEGGPLAQALALIGARPRLDGYGRVCGAELIPLSELGRPRVDVMATLSGIFRDLLPIQTRLLAEAAWLAASAADEPAEMNPVRAHALAHMKATGCDLETASLRVFSNADGAYGANVNQLVDSGAWDDENELADAYSKRKCFAYGRDGGVKAQPDLLEAVLSRVDMAYQNLESVELGVTTIDHYFDTLGGIGRAVTRARGTAAPTYIGDQTRGEGRVRSLSEQVALETRTRMLNPKWYEGMLKHGGEGVRQIEASVTNTLGWSATTGEVDPWVYQRMTETFVLDEAMRRRMAELNPKASLRMANRLIEAHERNYWTPDPATLEALRRAGEELEDRLEGVVEGAAA
jgi:magnesium chelatase subunit H